MEIKTEIKRTRPVDVFHQIIDLYEDLMQKQKLEN